MKAPAAARPRQADGWRDGCSDVGGPADGRPRLIVLCGPPHSGKPAFSETYLEGFTIVSSERIRTDHGRSFGKTVEEAKVWEAFEFHKRRALRQGRTVALDACYVSERAKRHALQGPNAQHRKVCIVFDVPLKTIRARCMKDGRLSVKEAERRWKAFRDHKPTPTEFKRQGFEEVWYFEGDRYPDAGRYRPANRSLG